MTNFFTHNFEIMLLIGSGLLLFSVLSSKVSDRFGVPALIIFITIGMLAGSEGIGGIYFNDPWLAKSLGTIALVFILFAGGFDTRWKDIRHIFLSGLSLSTLGVLFTAIAVGLFATYVLHFTFLEGLLLGAIVSSTDAAAVFNVLRSKNIGLRGKLQPLLEFESGSNDPMAVFLTVGVLSLIKNPTTSPADLIPSFFLEMGIGAIGGYLFSQLIIYVVNRLKLSFEGLYPVLLIALVTLTYALTASLHGNGFLAVYLAGVLAGNANLIHKKTLKNFSDGLAWLMQIVMFLTLGLLVFPSHIVPILGTGLLISLFLIFIARPIGVHLCLLFANLKFREKMFIAWVGLRGAVPIILATFPLLDGIPKAEMIFNIVFFIVITSVFLQASAMPFFAKILQIEVPLKNKRNYPIEFEHTGEINANLEDMLIPFNSFAIGKPLFEIKVPDGCLVVLISRDEKFFIPKGSTILQESDVLLVLASHQDYKKLQSLLAKQKPID